MNNQEITKNYELLIGIDAGKNTGFAVWNTYLKEFRILETILIHQALAKVIVLQNAGYKIKVYVEDARLRKWFGNAGREQLQGAGSIKRDCTIWEDFLTDLKIDFELVAPKNNKTKLTAQTFKSYTKYQGLTNVHNRDAGMLVFAKVS